MLTELGGGIPNGLLLLVDGRNVVDDVEESNEY
jgi:archaellum biogenesis ATPase FlaH